MKMNKKVNKKVLIAIIAILGFAFVFKIGVFDNVHLLFLIAEGQDDPSAAYYFIIERIYKIAEKRDIGKGLIQNINTGKNGSLHYQYIRVLGVIGENDAIPCLMKIYIDYQDIDSGAGRTMRSSVINSLGLIGDGNVVPFLEKTLNKYPDETLNFEIAHALYLLTGERYDVNWQGNKQEFVATKRTMYARKVILDTGWRKRKLEDMIILDKTLRPPGR